MIPPWDLIKTKNMFKNLVEIAAKRAYPFLLYLTLVFFIPVIGAGVYEFVEAFCHYWGNHDAIKLLIDILHSLEFFFIAPIPALIVFSFKRYILAFFPNTVSVNIDEAASAGAGTDQISVKKEKRNPITPEHAERAFIASLIGVSATFLLGKAIESFNGELNYLLILLFIVLLLFMGILIIFFVVLSKQIREEEENG